MKRDGQEQEMPVFPVNSQRNMVIKVGGVEASNIRIKTGEEIEYLKDDEWVVGTVISYNSIKIQDKEVVELPANTPIRLKKNTQTSGILVLDIELYNIEYGSSDLQMMYQFLYGSGIIKDKLFGNIIASGGRQITVQSSMYVIDGFVGFFKIPQNVVVDIGDASVRKDLLVLRKVQAEGSIYLIIKKGVPSPNPSLPELTQNENGIYEIPVAEITVQANAQTISQGDIKDVRRNLRTLDELQKRYMIPPYYTQYPDVNGNFNNNEEPSNWYKKMYGVTTTWQIMFNTESVYFRTEGDLAYNGRNNGIQGDAIRNIVGRSNDVSPLTSTASRTPFSGALYFDQYRTNTNYKAQNATNQPWGYIELCIDASRVVPIASENRVRNRLIRVYKLLSINGVSVEKILQGA